jgi:hypothetical protein
MTNDDKAKQARRRLDRVRQLMKEYRATWGIPLDKETFLNIWAQARKELA